MRDFQPVAVIGSKSFKSFAECAIGQDGDLCAPDWLFSCSGQFRQDPEQACLVQIPRNRQNDRTQLLAGTDVRSAQLADCLGVFLRMFGDEAQKVDAANEGDLAVIKAFGGHIIRIACYGSNP
jgi:hypothetical protein